MTSIRDRIEKNSNELSQTPVAIEAFWDGDSSGWFVILTAILKDGDGYCDSFLGAIQDGGDLRLFNGQVPPWPEAAFATEMGTKLATRFGVPFFFPSPDRPEDDCPRWWEQAQAYPCRRCGLQLLQKGRCPWRGVCYHCHLDEEREKKEAAWTPEQRAGPRCRTCGDPATGTLGSGPACEHCLGRYKCRECSDCGVSMLVSRELYTSSRCSRCDIRIKLDAVPEDQRKAIRIASREGGARAGVHLAIELLGFDLYEAEDAERAFRDPVDSEELSSSPEADLRE